jgi:multiple sugar transport system permease protein
MVDLKRKNKWYPYFLVFPTLLIIGVILLYPMMTGLALSFQNRILTRPVPDNERFIGLKNYIALFKDPIFRISLLKTGEWVFFSVFLQLLLGLVTALVLNQRFHLRVLVRGLILIPWVLPGVVAALLWSWIMDGTYGLLNDVLARFRLITENIPWLGNPRTAFPVVIATNIWKGFPFFAVSILAGLQAIPVDLYEAAEIDGAGMWRRFLTVTLPFLKPVIFTTTVLRIIWTTNTTDLIFTMTQGGPGYTTHVLALYTSLTAWGRLDFGYSSAMAIILMVIMLVVIAIYLKTADKEGEAGL